ncbi:glycerate kinase [Sporomusa aerivorans]|uniref:glycerate kinase n=1 Tax=Sporomusa aerivorans TaxID=204936 RepID=UPI00352AEF45
MRIVVAPDSYKGSLSAVAVASAMEQGILSVFPHAEVIKVPIADGGEGTVEALVTATHGRIIHEEVTGPLGDPVQAFWGLLGDGETGVIEMAAASGLPLVPKDRRDPRITTTIGTGQLIKSALDQGVRKLIIGIGGSATNDGGAGMAQALGVKFLDAAGQELPPGGAALAGLTAINLAGLDSRLIETTIMVACDVDNPLCGPRGASAVYGPQKGATPAIIAELDAALGQFAAIAKAATGKDIAELPGAGAAGGLGAGLLFFTNAQLRPGVEIVLETTSFAAIVKDAALVITGEGNTDFQTAYGKAPVGVAKIAKQFNVPTVCLSGGLGKDHEKVLEHGINGLMSILPHPMSLEECVASASPLVQSAAARLCRLIQIGSTIHNR